MSNSHPVFATPLIQSTRSEILEWRFPKPYHQYTLTGKSRAAWHTSFVIPELNLLLDAGLVVNNARPKHIFLTHGHSDHALLTPAFVKRDDPPDIFCPVEIKDVLDDYIRAKVVMNRGGAAGAVAEEEGEDDDDVAGGGDVQEQETESPDTAAAVVTYDTYDGRPPTHITHGLRHGDVVPLRRLKPPVQMTATAFSCIHNVPSIGYVFHSTTPKLKPEYRGLPGPTLKQLRQSGTELTAPHEVPVFAFLGDGTAETLAGEPEWLRAGVRVVITECSFLESRHRAVAEKTKHTLWEDLEPVVRKWKRTTFVVTHFSLRYSDDEVRRFFEGREGLGNVVVWC